MAQYLRDTSSHSALRALIYVLVIVALLLFVGSAIFGYFRYTRQLSSAVSEPQSWYSELANEMYCSIAWKTDSICLDGLRESLMSYTESQLVPITVTDENGVQYLAIVSAVVMEQKGEDGEDGQDGTAGVDGSDGDDAEDGQDGVDGEAGLSGSDGATYSIGTGLELDDETLSIDSTYTNSFLTATSTNILTNKSGSISMWTNDLSYITDGNTNWDNSYGYITDGNTNWDNSYGYITGVDFDDISNATGTYLNYKPNNVACTANQVLKYDTTNSRWSCADDNSANEFGATIDSSEITDGTIVNDDVSASAGIALTKLATVTIDRALVSDGSGNIAVSAVTSTELGYVSGVTSAIQTQLNAKQATISNGADALTTAEVDQLENIGTSVISATQWGYLGGLTATDTELNILDGVTSSTAELNVLDGIPATLTATELGYVDGVTSAIQTQLNAKQASITNGVDALTSAEVDQLEAIGTSVISAAQWGYLGALTSTGTELNYLDGTTVTTGGVVYGDGTKLAQDVAEFFWDATTNELGIGTNAPGSALHVVGDGRFTDNLQVDNVLVFPFGGASDYYTTGATGDSAIYSTSASGAAYPFLEAGNLVIQSRHDFSRDIVFVTGATEAVSLVVGRTGFIGIGDTSPEDFLDINTTATTNGISFDGLLALSGYSGNGYLRLNQNSSFVSGVYTPGALRSDGEFQQGTTDAGAYGIQTSTAMYAGDYLAALGGVHVGGTSDPGTDNLVVDGTIDAVGQIETNNGAKGVILRTDGTHTDIESVGAALAINFQNNQDVIIADSGTGQVFMPNTYADTVGVTNRDLFIDSTGLVGYVSSSQRYKENIQDLEGIDWLYQLRPVSYTLKSEPNAGAQMGLIAEEVDQINKHLVSYDDEGRPETVSYSRLITPLLEAVQRHNARIEDLEDLFASTSFNATPSGMVSFDEATIKGNIKVLGALSVSGQNAGTATITSGNDNIVITFPSALPSSPSVTISSVDHSHEAYVTAISTTSFTIKLQNGAVGEDSIFNWIALPVH